MDAPSLNPQPTLCDGLVEAIADSLRAQAAEMGVEIVVERSAEDVVARTDRRTLGTILMHLIGGAVVSAPRGRVHISVARHAAVGARCVEISVNELAGAGSAPAGSRQQQMPPLAATRELAARLGGQISVHVRSGGSSTYVLRIPEG